jgi:hypothetical protein
MCPQDGASKARPVGTGRQPAFTGKCPIASTYETFPERTDIRITLLMGKVWAMRYAVKNLYIM